MDGESTLIQACNTLISFCNSPPMHIKDKLHELSIPENVRLVITQDIFGKQIGSCHYKGVLSMARVMVSLRKEWRC